MKLKIRIVVISILLALLNTINWSTASHAQSLPVARDIKEFPASFPYAAYESKDNLGRHIQFYLTDKTATDERPLMVILQGSGCASNFMLRDGKVAGSWHGLVRRANNGRAQILLIDKPGVNLFDSPTNPGSTDSCSQEFRREQTGERWLAAIGTALKGAIALRGKNPKAILALGHSEGAVFAVRLALQHPDISHVAALAAVPASQLLSFYDMAFSSEGFIASGGGSKSEQTRRVTQAWRDVSSDPQSAEKIVFGHPHRYWADKFTPFPYEKLEKTNAKFFLAFGDKDTNSAPRTMDAFAVELLTRNRDLTWIRVEDADHGFTKTGAAPGSGMAPMLDRVTAWFFNEPFDQSHVVWPITANPSGTPNPTNTANPT